jgi:hypothetical protein
MQFFIVEPNKKSMKTIIRISAISFGFLLLASCEHASRYDGDEPITPVPETIIMNLDAEFLGAATPYDNSVISSKGELVPDIPTVEDCGSGYQQMIESAQGKESTLGIVSFLSVFCFGQESILPTYSYIQTLEGDVLYVSYSGKTRTGKIAGNSQQPKEIWTWETQFTIKGGTGRFEGATGHGTTNDFIESECEFGHNCHHSWKGELTVLRKNW